jgi:Mce-associated membrane protein
VIVFAGHTVAYPGTCWVVDNGVSRRWLLRGAVIGLVTVLIAGWTITLLSHGHSGRARVRTAAAVVSARTGAIDFFSLDAGHAEADFARMLALTTGDFHDRYLASHDQVIARVEQKNLVDTAEVPADGAGLETYDDERAQVLVAVDVVTRVGASAPETDHRRVRVTVERSGEKWRISALDLIGPSTGPGSYQVAGLPSADSGPVRAALIAAGRSLGYDYRRLDKDLDAATALMTPAFGAQYRHTFATAVRPLAVERKVVTAAYVRGGALVRRLRDHARVLVFADQVLNPGPGGRPSAVRVLVDLDRTGGSWLISGIMPI